MKNFSIQSDIRQAKTLPGQFYKDPAVFEQVKEKIFARAPISISS